MRHIFCSMKTKISTIFFLVVSIFGSCPATIDTVWFSQRSGCEDLGLVDICYVLSSPCTDSTFSIRFQVSTDGGDSWAIRPRTVDFLEGEFGDDVHVGTHCFVWNSLADMEEWQGSNFMIRMFLEWEILHVDSFFEFEESEYLTSGNDAYVDPESLYFVLSQNMPDRNGRFMTVDTFKNDTMGIEFDFKIDPSVGCAYPSDPTGGDGISFIFSPLEPPPMTSGPAMGLLGSQGWGFEIDIFENNCSFSTDNDGNHVAVSVDSVGCMWSSDSIPLSLVQRNVPYELADGNWHHVDIRLSYPQIRFYLDGYLRIHSFLIFLPTPEDIHLGFFGSTGRCHAGHYIDNLIIRRPNFLVTEESEFEAMGTLDTEPPTVHLTCPEPTEDGEFGHFEWTVEDSFPGTGICSLFVEYDGFTDTVTTLANSAEVLVFPSCVSINATVSVPDSFCNRNTSTCSFTSCTSPRGLVICGPTDSFSSCPGQSINFALFDTLCALQIDSVWLSVEKSSGNEYFQTGDSEVIISFSAETTFVLLGGYGSIDGDTTTVYIDSVHYETGCRSRIR